MNKMVFTLVAAVAVANCTFAQAKVQAEKTAPVQITGTAPEELPPTQAMVAEKTVQDMVDEYLAGQGWSGGRNDKNGRTFYIATGSAIVRAPRTGRNYIKSRSDAFSRAMLAAQENMVSYLTAEIGTTTEQVTVEGDYGAVGANRDAVESDPNSLTGKIDKFLQGKIEKALAAEGMDPKTATKEAKARIAKKLLASEQFVKVIKSAATAESSAMQAICTFEGKGDAEHGEVGVVAVWSPKLQEMAMSIATKKPVAGVKPKKPIVQQVSENPEALLSTFGVQQKIDEHGNLVLVSFAQAGAVKDTGLAVDNAKSRARTMAQGMIREFAGASYKVSSDLLSAESTEVFEKAAEAYESVGAFSRTIKAESANMKLPGISTVKTWQMKHPFSGLMVYGCICSWSPVQAAHAAAVLEGTAGDSGARQTPGGQPKTGAGAGQSGDVDAF